MGGRAGGDKEAGGCEGFQFGGCLRGGEMGEGGVAADVDGGVLGEVVAQQGAALVGRGYGVWKVRGELLYSGFKGGLEAGEELGLGIEVDAADVEVGGANLVGQGDEGGMSFGIFVAGNTDGEGAEAAKFHVMALGEVTGSKGDDGLHDTFDIGSRGAGRGLNLFRQRIEGDGLDVDCLGVEGTDFFAIDCDGTGRRAEIILNGHAMNGEYRIRNLGK